MAEDARKTATEDPRATRVYVGADPRDSEFLRAASEFMAAHEDVLRELAKH